MWVRGWKWHLSPCLYQLTSDVSLNSLSVLIGRGRRAVGQWEAAWYSSLLAVEGRPSLENSRERQTPPDTQVGTSRSNHHLNCLLCLDCICRFSLSWVFNYSLTQACEGGHWLVRWALIFIRPFLPMFVWLACELPLELQWSRSVSGWFEVSSLVLP